MQMEWQMSKLIQTVDPAQQNFVYETDNASNFNINYSLLLQYLKFHSKHNEMHQSYFYIALGHACVLLVQTLKKHGDTRPSASSSTRKMKYMPLQRTIRRVRPLRSLGQNLGRVQDLLR